MLVCLFYEKNYVLLVRRFNLLLGYAVTVTQVARQAVASNEHKSIRPDVTGLSRGRVSQGKMQSSAFSLEGVFLQLSACGCATSVALLAPPLRSVPVALSQRWSRRV